VVQDGPWPILDGPMNNKLAEAGHILYLRQTLEGYISKDIYIPYPIQKSRKRIFPYPFFEWDMLKDIISLFKGFTNFYILSYPISFLEKFDNFGVLLLYKMHFFVKYRNKL
jgi:hypothetical protein